MAVGGDGENLAGMTGGQNLLHDLHQHRLSGTALLNDKGVGALHLLGAAVEQAALVLAEEQIVHHLLQVAAVGTDQVDALLPILLAAALGGAGVRQHINGQQASGEGELIPVGGVQGALTLFNSSLGQITHDVRAVLRHLNIMSQRIVLHILVHFVYLHHLGAVHLCFLEDTPVVGSGLNPTPATGGQ